MVGEEGVEERRPPDKPTNPLSPSLLTSLTTKVEAERTTLSASTIERGDVAVGWWNMARFG